MKKILSLVLVLALAVAMSLSLASCGESGPKVVAEGVGHTEWGMVMDLLYQEYSDGTVKVYMPCKYEGQADSQVNFSGTVVKGTDSDGDPVVTLTITGAEMIGDTGEGFQVQDGSAWIDETEILSNTYDSASGAYTIPFEYSLFGYTPLTVNIDVTKTSSPSDPVEWAKQYITIEYPAE